MPSPATPHPASDRFDPPPTPGRLVRYAREQAYLSQVQLADRAGVSVSTLSRLESGQRPARWDLVVRVLACLQRQPRIVLEALDAHLAEQLAAEAARPALEWLLDAMTDVLPALRLARAEGLAVDGSLAARLHGVAMPVGDVHLLVPPSCSSGQLELGASQHWIGLRQEDEDELTWWARRPERWVVAHRVDALPPVVEVVPPYLPGSGALVGAVAVVALDHLRLEDDERRLLRHAVSRDDAA